jgi:hypothetical protein
VDLLGDLGEADALVDAGLVLRHRGGQELLVAGGDADGDPLGRRQAATSAAPSRSLGFAPSSGMA